MANALSDSPERAMTSLILLIIKTTIKLIYPNMDNKIDFGFEIIHIWITFAS